MKRFAFLMTVLLASASVSWAQFTDSQSGLLQMPTADMQEGGTFMITNNYLNRHSLPSSGWTYDTFAYAISIAFWDRLEVGYVCTIFDGKKSGNLLLFNQDRHFYGRIQLLKEGQFGWKWMPSIVVGWSDPATGSSSGGYSDFDTSGSGNGYFSRMYAVATKHFNTGWGEVGVHLGYQYNDRSDYRINAPCGGVNWKPRWLCDVWLIDNINFVAEYDSRTFNTGFIASIWNNHFEAMFELQNLRWINFGLRYKLRLR